MNAITNGASAPAVFHFNSLPITVILKDGEPWFIASEVLAALELHRTAIRRLEEDEKGVHKTHTLGGEQEVSIISEPGLYRLIGRSNKPAAKAFNRWVCHDVLPAIRKTGRYETQSLPPPASAIDRLTRSRINRRALELSHRAYETYRDQMLTCHLIKSSLVAIEEWLPPQLAEDVIRDARLVANVLDIYSSSIRNTAAAIARLAGLTEGDRTQ